VILFLFLCAPQFAAVPRSASRTANEESQKNKGFLLVPAERIELPTFGLQNRCSTAELSRQGLEKP
jgi:hypothetical protein